MFGRKKKTEADLVTDSDPDDRRTSSQTLTAEPTTAQIKRATRTRLIWSLIASFCLLVAVVFTIMVEIGSTRQNNSILTNIYFINLDLSNIIPLSVPDAVLINSIARTLGLHDYYRVGLWGFCEGYYGQGVTGCSSPETLYWFNPVEIIQSELLAGATIALPAEINDVLGLIRTVSHWMFVLFLTGACVNFISIFLVPLAVFTRWATLFIMIWTFLGALFTAVATVIATVLFIIMKRAITAQKTLNIGASLGIKMWAFMWTSAAGAVVAWLIMLCLCCCCASRRDIKMGKKRGSKKAWAGETEVGEKGQKRSKKPGWFGRRKSQ